jgi:hypothetical protein
MPGLIVWPLQIQIHERSGHKLVSANFALPTYCASCAGFLWGVGIQGYQCLDCNTVTHKKPDCATLLAACPGAPPKGSNVAPGKLSISPRTSPKAPKKPERKPSKHSLTLSAGMEKFWPHSACGTRCRLEALPHYGHLD